jgi:hypothetical protein
LYVYAGNNQIVRLNGMVNALILDKLVDSFKKLLDDGLVIIVRSLNPERTRFQDSAQVTDCDPWFKPVTAQMYVAHSHSQHKQNQQPSSDLPAF